MPLKSKDSGEGRFFYLVRCRFAPVSLLPEWNNWYAEKHIPEMLSVPGIQSVQRFQDLSAEGSFLAIYTLDSPDVFEHKRYSEVRGWGKWESNIVDWSRQLVREHTINGDSGRDL
jgi:hypothetical protein